MQFGNELDVNVAICEELLQGIAPAGRHDAKRAAAQVEKIIMALQKDNPHNPNVMLGTFYAVFKIAERIVKGPKESDKNGGDNVIQLLS
jgi:hypothetical protein